MNKILVVRNDKIGDFMLAWPSFAMLKKSLPNSEIVALVPGYTSDLAKLCPWIDGVIIDDQKNKRATVAEIKKYNFDVSINLFSNTHNALLVRKAGIPYRLAPATKLAQFLYNRRVTQHRSKSVKPEYEYNLDLIRFFLKERSIPVVEPSGPYLSFQRDELVNHKSHLAKRLNLCLTRPWLFIHAGTGGSSTSLTSDQFVELVSGLDDCYQIVLTCGPNEEQNAYSLSSSIKETGKNCIVYDDNLSLSEFSKSIACANVFIAGSTGPLHIAAALDVLTVGFFPAKRSSSSLRWQPINSANRHIAFSPEGGKTKAEMSDFNRIDIQKVLKQVNPWLALY